MIVFELLSPHEVELLLAAKARERRLALNLTQSSLAERSGVSLGTLKKFERSGKISLAALLKLAVILDCLMDFEKLFQAPTSESFHTLDDLLKQKKLRQRGRN
jgi:hypothetical protein